jgi:hypothetical protein
LGGISGKLIFKWKFEEYSVRMWTEFVWFRIASAMGSYGHNYEPSGFVTGRQFLQ